jgi:hypothetical protein
MSQGLTLYNKDGVPIMTHSMIKQGRGCLKAFSYKYVERLKPRSIGRPLQFGKWMHWLLEAYYKGEDWRAVHKQLSIQYSGLFDEEKEKLGDLPHDCYELMLSYLWHYKHENWTVHEVEFLVECAWPDGSLYRGKIDMLVEDDYGLWIVDHKNHKRLPSASFRLKDSQSGLYVWAARKMGIPVAGFIWNYLKTAPPSKPKLIKNESRFYTKLGDTTYVTYRRELKRLGIEPDDPRAAATVERLARDRYKPGQIQTSPFFQRHVFERNDGVLRRIAGEAYATHQRLQAYHWDKPNRVERAPGNQCDFMCSYTRLCEAELYGSGMVGNIRRQDFREADPMEYYNDERELGT